MAENPKITKKTPEVVILLGWVDLYVTRVQSAPYARRMQVAMLWSAISLLYLVFGLEVESSSTATLLGVSINGIDHETFRVVLLAMTSYYVVLLGFVFAKVWSVTRPVRLFCRLFRAKTRRTRDQNIEVGEGADDAIDQDLALWDAKPDVQPESLTDKGFCIPVVPNMKSEDESRYFMVRYPLFGLLENLCARMLFPALVCVGTLAWLVAEIFF